MNEQSKPNILVILSDQHAAAFTGCYGHPVVQTPNIDRLAQTGVKFEHAYCSSPLCVPSRMSFMTGKRNQNIETWDNNCILPSNQKTLGHRLNDVGYDAVLCGRMHFNGDDKLHGFRIQLARDPDANASIPDWQNVGVMNGHSLTRPDKNASIGDGCEHDATAEDAAINYINKRNEQPWAMIVGFVHPHGPRNAEQRFWNLYPFDNIDLPKTKETSSVDRHPIHCRNRQLRQMPECGFTERDIRRARAGYYAAISQMDEKVGSIMTALESSGQRQNTIVIYISDHGEMLGDHNLWMKSSMFENSIRIPMIVSSPEFFPAGIIIEENVSMIDLTAAICYWAGAEQTGLDGTSFANLITNQDSAWKNQALVEFYGTWTDRPMAAYIKGSLKLIYSYNESPQLFDLRNDPLESHDLSHQEEYQSILQELIGELLEQWPCQELYKRVLASQKARLA